MFFALAGFPGGNFFIGGLLCVPLSLSFAYAFGLMATAIPRSGGDYVIVSRILHPLLAVVSMFCMTLAQFLSIAFLGKAFATLAIAPGLQIVGLLANSGTLFDWGTTVAASRGWQFAFAVLVIAAIGLLYIGGTHWVKRFVIACVVLSMAGLLFAVLVALFTSKGSFIAHFNSFAEPFTGNGNTYGDVLGTAARNDVPLNPDFSLSNTIPLIGVFATTTIFTWNGAYVAGELREATSTKTANRMALAALLGIGGTLLCAATFFKAWGTDFLTGIYGGGLPEALGTTPTYFFLTSAQLGSAILGAVLCLTFAVAFPLSASVAMITPPRSLFAMGFDGVMPRALATVSKRTNTPIVAIVTTLVPTVLVTFWAIFISDSFAQVIVYATLVQLIAMGLVAVSALVFPYRRPELYRASSSQHRVLGVPLVSIAGGLALATVVFLYWLFFKYSFFGLADKTAFLPWLLGTIGLAIACYYGARAVRRREGIDLDMVYAEIPPE